MNTLAVQNPSFSHLPLGSILGSSHEALVVTGSGNRIEFANPRFLELTGWTGSTENRTLDDLATAWEAKAGRPEVIGAYFRNCLTETPDGIPRELQPGPGQVVEARFQIITGEDGTEYRVWFFHEWRTSALAWVSHEIKNPLNAVLGFSELLGDALGAQPANEQVKASLRGLRISATHLQAVLGDLLNLSRLESGVVAAKPAWVNLAGFLEDLLELFRNRFSRRGLQFYVEGPGGAAVDLWIDQGRLSQILGNLVSNALRFTNKGHVAILVRTTGSTWEFQVEDTGDGIPIDQQKTIFDPFVQKQGQDPQKFGGTGLGLAICKTLVQSLGGQLTLESRPGQGSRFAAVFENLPSRPAGASDSGFNPGKIPPCTLLVVDDEQTNHLLVDGFLRDSPVTVLTANDGYQAIELWKQHRPGLVLLDMRMTGLSGIETARRIRELDPEGTTKFLGMSASRPDSTQVSQGWGLWSGFLEKPFGKGDFLSFLSNHVTFIDESPSWT